MAAIVSRAIKRLVKSSTSASDFTIIDSMTSRVALKAFEESIAAIEPGEICSDLLEMTTSMALVYDPVVGSHSGTRI